MGVVIIFRHDGLGILALKPFLRLHEFFFRPRENSAPTHTFHGISRSKHKKRRTKPSSARGNFFSWRIGAHHTQCAGDETPARENDSMRLRLAGPIILLDKAAHATSAGLSLNIQKTKKAQPAALAFNKSVAHCAFDCRPKIAQIFSYTARRPVSHIQDCSSYVDFFFNSQLRKSMWVTLVASNSFRPPSRIAHTAPRPAACRCGRSHSRVL